jgi:bifunctional oligoribonuclease and PAP phosphatase NrnA
MPSELTPKQQFAELVRTAQSILVLTHAHPDGDALGSALALKHGLEKLDKKVTVAAAGRIPDYLDFLPGFSDIQNEFSASKDLLVMIDESQARVGNVSLKRVSETKLMLIISPKEGLLTAANIMLEDGNFKSDLIIVLDSADLDRLGDIYEQNPSLFFEVPTINIDHHPGNTNFAKVNLVEVTASSTAEILVSLLETVGKDVPGMIDEEIATCLLAGIMSDTGSFQNTNTTPKSLTVAAQMVAAGARQNEITRRIFKTRSLAQLRLWGRVLSYIKEDSRHRFAWSVLTRADYVASQADAEATGGVLDELLKSAEGMDFVVLIYEREGGVKISFRSLQPHIDVARLAHVLGGGGHTQAAAAFLPDTSVGESEQRIIGSIRDQLSGSFKSEENNNEIGEDIALPNPQEPQAPRDPADETPTSIELSSGRPNGNSNPQPEKDTPVAPPSAIEKRPSARDSRQRPSRSSTTPAAPKTGSDLD